MQRQAINFHIAARNPATFHATPCFRTGERGNAQTVKEIRMKLAAMAVMLAFVAAPAVAQQYPGAANPSAANPSTTDQASPATSSTSSDTRTASNKHRKHQQSQSTSSQSQMGGSQATPSQDSAGAAQGQSPTSRP